MQKHEEVRHSLAYCIINDEEVEFASLSSWLENVDITGICGNLYIYPRISGQNGNAFQNTYREEAPSPIWEEHMAYGFVIQKTVLLEKHEIVRPAGAL